MEGKTKRKASIKYMYAPNFEKKKKNNSHDQLR